MNVYYNENDPYAAEWLRQLIAAGHLPAGTVDERDIRLVGGSDLDGFDQCHFFAGIGGWPLALQLAGWDRPCWTGSCPCQPFSAAGQRRGSADDRHLWPEFHRLIAECHPSVLFGEQVAGKDGLLWLAGVRTDLEALGYAVGAADLCAAGIGAPHIRQRCWFVAQGVDDTSSSERLRGEYGPQGRNLAQYRRGLRAMWTAWQGSGDASGLDNADEEGRTGGSRRQHDSGYRNELANGSGMGVANGPRSQSGEQAAATARHRDTAVAASDVCGMGYAGSPGLEGRGVSERRRSDQRVAWETGDDACWLPCTDGKARRIGIEPSTFPLAHGVPNRVGRLRGYGNAIVPQLAAEFVAAFAECSNIAERAAGGSA